MTPATLITEFIDGNRILVLDCQHATTHAALIGPPGEPQPEYSEVTVVRMALLKHFLEERCACTLPLRRHPVAPA